MYHISLIMVTYNSKEMLADSLGGLLNLDDVEIIVVDNASTDGTQDHVKSDYPSIQLLENSENQGFALAVNQGVAASNGEYILLLNPDAIIDYQTLRELVERSHENRRLGIVAPTLFSPSERIKTLNGGFEPNLWRMFTHATGASRFAKRANWLSGHYLLDGQQEDVQHLDWVTGGCVLIKRETWDQLGGLSTRWFMYAEDIEFCLRANDLGWMTVLYGDLKAQHIIGGSSKGFDGRASSTWVRHLFELYVSRCNAGYIRQLLWKNIVCTGFLGRELFNRVLFALFRGKEYYSTNAHRFRIYRLDLIRHQIL